MSDVAGNPATASTSTNIDATVGITVDIVDVNDLINTNEVSGVLISGTVTGVEDGQDITIIVTDINGISCELQTQVTGNTWSLALQDLSAFAEGTLTATASVTDIAGNSTTAETQAIKDTLADITITVVDSNNVINATEIPQVVIRGTALNVENGQTITVTLTDSTGYSRQLTTTVIAGAWSLNALDLSDFADGTLTASATVTDLAGNPATSSTTINIDTQASITVQIIDNDGVINAVELTQVIVNGTVSNIENGQTVTVTLSDANGNSRQVATTVVNGAWTLPPQDLTGFDDGSLTATANAIDIAGNSVDAIASTIVDTQATITISITDDNGLINGTEVTAVLISGTVANIEDGRSVSVTLTDASGTHSRQVDAIVTNGVWALTAQDLGNFTQGNFTASASVTDLAGNSATASTNAVIDTVISIDIDTGVGFNAALFMNGVDKSLAGTTQGAEAGQTVTLKVNDGTQTKTFITTVGSDGSWLFENIDINGLDATASWMMDVSVTDQAGNTATDAMPTLDFPAGTNMFEVLLNTQVSIDAQVTFDINDASLSLSADQNRLLTVTSNGQAVNIVMGSDGLSFQLFRTDGELVMDVALNGTSLNISLLQPLDKLNDNSVTTYIKLEALQTDSDGTQEKIFTYALLNIYDSPALAIDDTYNVIEATTITGSLTGNDYTIEGPLKVTHIDYQGINYAIAAGAPAVVNTAYGTLTVYQNGSWQFIAAENLDNTLPQEFSFDYQVVDNDGSLSTATVNFTINDGAAGTMPNITAMSTEADIDGTLSQQQNFTITAGSDTLLAASVAFSASTTSQLTNLGLTSQGVALTYTLSGDGKTITATAGGITVFTLNLVATNNGDDVNVAATLNLLEPLDHITSDTFTLKTGVIAQDLDGTAISTGNLTWQIKDGGSPHINNVTSVNFDEALGFASPQTQNSSFDLRVGSDAITSLVFAVANQQPNLTAGGVAIIYTLSADGHTITAHTGDINDPVFVVELAGTWNSQIDSIGQSYTATVYRPFDQIGSEDVNLKLMVTDFDGDRTNATLTMTVLDDDSGTIDNITLDISELPTVNAFDNVETGQFSISTNGDPIVDAKFGITNGAQVLDASGNAITQNGQNLVWSVKDGGATIEGITNGGDVVFRISVPTSVHIDANTTGQVQVSVTVLGAIDHLTGGGTVSVLDIPLNIIDSDNTISTGQVQINLYDGANPSLPTISQLMIDEAGLVFSSSVSIQGTLNIVQGSDDVASVQLANGFTLGAYTSNGQVINLAGTADANGWYNATRAGDNATVFQVRFGNDGKIEFVQKKPLDHPAGNGVNNLDITLQVQAVDTDGDRSGAQTITVTVKDDTPVQFDNSYVFTESNGEVYNVQLFSLAQQGADGAVVNKFTYQGVDYAAGDTVILKTDTNETYGTLVIRADGSATLTTQQFDYAAGNFDDTIALHVTDTDGDTVVNHINLSAQDNEGSVIVRNPQFVEDESGPLVIIASPGDIDQGEVIQSIVFTMSTLAGGSLTLDGNTVAIDGNGNYILTGSDLLIDGATGIATPNGVLRYTPVEDASDATSNVEFEITVNILNKSPIVTTVPISITSVADTPEWSDSSEFSYSVLEDGGPTALNLEASSKDMVGADSQGSEVVTYVVDNIASGLNLTTTSGTIVTNGMVLTAQQFADLQAEVDANLAGQFSFTVQATTTEPDNGDTANSTVETVVINVTPVADKPTLTTRNITSQEDAHIALNTIIGGQLTDQSGSETLRFELTLPVGWTIVAATAIDLGNGVWTVAAADVTSGAAQLIPAEDVSSANLGDFMLSIRSYATESTQGGIDPADTVTDQNPNYSASQTVTVKLTGVANDVPTIAGNVTDWSINEATGVISNATPFAEDALIPLDFLIVTSDNDGSEELSLTFSGLPDGAILLDSAGVPVSLPVVGFEVNGDPIYSVLASLFAKLFLQPPVDFSGEISFKIYTESTELDGDSANYELTLGINITPAVDATAASLQTTSTGFEDQAIVLTLMPDLSTDSDGSETVTGMTIQPLTNGIVLLFDGSPVEIPIGGLDFSTLLDANSPTLAELLTSGRIAVLPPEDASGSVSFDIGYEITDTSSTGQQVTSNITTTMLVSAAAVVDPDTHLQANQPLLTSTDGSAINLSNAVDFYDADLDGSEVLDYIVITVPEGDGWFITHPNGAIHDGDGRWLIPTNGMTSNTVAEQALKILAGATIASDHITNGPVNVIIEARVLDGGDAAVIKTQIAVQFNQAGAQSNATDVGSLQLTPVDAIEDNSISFAGHLNVNLSSDSNDVISLRILASDLPEGGVITGSDVIILYDSTGENVIEYVFTTASLGNLALSGISADFAGDLDIPIRIIATDSVSGDTKFDDSQVIAIDITPVVDSVTVKVANSPMLEDQPNALGISLHFKDSDTSPVTGGQEMLVLGDPAQPVSLVLLDGGSINDPSGFFQLKAGTTDTWEFTGSTQIQLTLALAQIQYVPIEHLSGDFRIQISGIVVDTASINGSNVTNTNSFSETFSINVTPVVDQAQLPSSTIIIIGNEDTDINLTSLNRSDLGLIDQDGSEKIFITIHGAPEGSTFYAKDSSGNLVQLPNNGVDGGTFEGKPTYYWTVTPDQLDSLVFRPPLNFNGDIPLTLETITYEIGTDQYASNSVGIEIGVNPVADGVQLIKEPESQYLGQEDETIVIDFGAELIDATDNETMLMTITITSANASALVGLEGIRVGDNYVAFTANGSGGYSATLEVTGNSLSQFELLPGTLAFGTLNVQMDLSSKDATTVHGVATQDSSNAQTLTFDVELTPEVDPPIWTQVNDVTSNDVNNVALNLGLTLQNPAPGETGTLAIYGVPAYASLSSGSLQGDKWVVNIADVASLKLIGANDGDVINLTLTPSASLNGDTENGVTETITVTVDTAAIMSSNSVNSFNSSMEYFLDVNSRLILESSQKYSNRRHAGEFDPLPTFEQMQRVEQQETTTVMSRSAWALTAAYLQKETLVHTLPVKDIPQQQALAYEQQDSEHNLIAEPQLINRNSNEPIGFNADELIRTQNNSRHQPSIDEAPIYHEFNEHFALDNIDLVQQRDNSGDGSIALPPRDNDSVFARDNPDGAVNDAVATPTGVEPAVEDTAPSKHTYQDNTAQIDAPDGVDDTARFDGVAEAIRSALSLDEAPLYHQLPDTELYQASTELDYINQFMKEQALINQ